MFVGMENAMNPIVPISTALTSNPVSFCINLVSFCNLLYVLRTVFVKYIYKILFRLLFHYVVVCVCVFVCFHTSNIELVNMLNQHCWIRKHYEAYMPHVRIYTLHRAYSIFSFSFTFDFVGSTVCWQKPTPNTNWCRFASNEFYWASFVLYTAFCLV